MNKKINTNQNNDINKRINLVEVYSDIAGSKIGASFGIDALKQSCEDINSKYFSEFLSLVIKDENEAYLEKSEFVHAKYIDKIYLVIKRLAYRIKDLREKGIFPIVLSGDHASCAGTMHGLALAHKDDEIGVVYIDAHADIHSPYTSPSGNMHGMPLAAVCSLDNKENRIHDISEEEKKYWDKLKFFINNRASIDTKNIVFCALRNFEEPEKKLIKKHNISVHSVNDITLNGIKNTVKSIFKKLEHCRYIYISFDVDSIDPLYVPGTGTPASQGLSFEQALLLNLELIKNKKVCCWEIAEINPMFNKSEEDSIKLFKLLQEVTKALIKNY